MKTKNTTSIDCATADPKVSAVLAATEPEADGEVLPNTDWVFQTPRIENASIPPQLVIWEDGTDAQVNDLTLAEYNSLKIHLAQMRGILAPEVAANALHEFAGAEVAMKAPDWTPIPRSGTEVILQSTRNNIVYHLDDMLKRARRDAREYPDAIPTIMAEAMILSEVFAHWDSGSYQGDFENELPLIGAIRGTLKLVPQQAETANATLAGDDAEEAA